MELPNIFDYFDYRSYLRDYYDTRKSFDSKFSYRFFAREAGYNSSGLYPNIVSGINNLTENYLPKFVKALKLNESQSKHFKNMVKYTHESDPVKREKFLDKMLRQLPEKTRRLKKNHFEFYSKWYYVAVHQSLSILDFKDDFKELSDFINPGIRQSEAKNAIELLKELELISQDANGFWRPSQKSFVGGEEVGTIAIHEYHNIMMDQAKIAQRNIEKSQRHIITQTVAITSEMQQHIKEKIANMQKEIVNAIVSDDNSKPKEQVFQLNVQFFPITNKHVEEKNDV